MSDKKGEFLYMARLSEQTERFEDMVDYMKKYIQVAGDLRDDERNLLSIAYKNTVSSRRTAWRAISALETKEKTKVQFENHYKTKIEKELEEYCNDVITLIDNNLLKNSLNVESKVFYWKMKGDYFRYLSEFFTNDNFKKASDNALKCYQQASDIAEKELRPTDAIRLGLALNYSVFYYEIKNETNTAIKTAKKAFDDAIAELEHLDEEEQIDSATIMQLLRDNITLWNKESGEDEKIEKK